MDGGEYFEYTVKWPYMMESAEEIIENWLLKPKSVVPYEMSSNDQFLQTIYFEIMNQGECCKNYGPYPLAIWIGVKIRVLLVEVNYFLCSCSVCRR